MVIDMKEVHKLADTMQQVPLETLKSGAVFAVTLLCKPADGKGQPSQVIGAIYGEGWAEKPVNEKYPSKAYGLDVGTNGFGRGSTPVLVAAEDSSVIVGVKTQCVLRRTKLPTTSGKVAAEISL